MSLAGPGAGLMLGAAAIARGRSFSLAYDAACGWARAGRHQDALTWLAKAVKAGFSDRGHLDADPDLDLIREASAFQELRRKISP